MSEHTPGLLEVDMGNLLEAEDGILSAADARPLARTLVENLPPEYAAAPDLLAALDWLVRNVRLPDDANPETWAAGYNRARAAIAKARGEAQ